LSEHLTEQALGQEVLAWCNVCRRFTIHTVCRVAIGSKACKPDACQEHNARELTLQQKNRRDRLQRSRRNPKLFEDLS